MRISDKINCQTFPCEDVNHDAYLVPDIEIYPENIKLLVISESTPITHSDYYYENENAAFAQTTLKAFHQAGIEAASIWDLVEQGIYFTTAVKCGKTAYNIKTTTINTCSHILEKEINLFPNTLAYLLMGDVAIKAVNAIARRTTGKRAIPAGSTYKLRGGVYHFKGCRIFPSYLQVGPSFGIEKSKQRMIVEDIATAMRLIE